MRLKYTFEKMNLGNRTIVVPVDVEDDMFQGVIELNETAAYIFNLLNQEKSESEIVDAMEKEYNAPLDVLKTDVHNYIENFRENGLLV